MKPNQNGAVMSEVGGQDAAHGCADDEAAHNRDAVYARHAAEQLVGHGALSDDGRCGAPYESVDAENKHHRQRDEWATWSRRATRCVNVSTSRPDTHDVAEADSPFEGGVR